MNYIYFALFLQHSFFSSCWWVRAQDCRAGYWLCVCVCAFICDCEATSIGYVSKINIIWPLKLQKVNWKWRRKSEETTDFHPLFCHCVSTLFFFIFGVVDLILDSTTISDSFGFWFAAFISSTLYVIINVCICSYVNIMIVTQQRQRQQ